MKLLDAHREAAGDFSFLVLLFQSFDFYSRKSPEMVLELGGQLPFKKLFTALCFSPAATPQLAPPFLLANFLQVC